MEFASLFSSAGRLRRATKAKPRFGDVSAINGIHGRLGCVHAMARKPGSWIIPNIQEQREEFNKN
ncbi:hypothetical protein [Consotaella salsifontis]|uniref:hypothetical protein n=1 Tax=Consotaella salsifontis TaxID=1365950 RepID=UPI001A95C166|nr:hypothetical protein [Consotaella salsifontis]